MRPYDYGNPMIPYFYGAKATAANVPRTGECGNYTAEMFQTDFPQFFQQSDEGDPISLIPDTMMQMFIDQANTSILPSRWGSMWRYAAGLYVAHHGSMYLKTYSPGSSDASHENNADVAQDGQKGDGDSLSLAKALGNESDAGVSKTASDASQGDQTAVNQAEQGDRISQTNDSMKGLIIAMAAIAVAALSVIGVVVFRMTHRRDGR